MKNISLFQINKGSWITLIMIFMTLYSYGQSEKFLKTKEEARTALRNNGYRIIDEGQITISRDWAAKMIDVNYKSGYEYFFVGVVDDCNSCDIVLYAQDENDNLVTLEPELDRNGNVSSILYLFNGKPSPKIVLGMYVNSGFKYPSWIILGERVKPGN